VVGTTAVNGRFKLRVFLNSSEATLSGCSSRFNPADSKALPQIATRRRERTRLVEAEDEQVSRAADVVILASSLVTTPLI